MKSPKFSQKMKSKELDWTLFFSKGYLVIFFLKREIMNERIFCTYALLLKAKAQSLVTF
jgi:hypothetical protein